MAVIAGFDDALRELEADWDPDQPPLQTALSTVGYHLVEQVGAFQADDIRTMFDRIEHMLRDGSDDEQIAAATGFLESVVAVISRNPDRTYLLDYAGAASRSHIEKWDKFYGVDR